MTPLEHLDFLRGWLRSAREDLAGALEDVEDLERPPRHACFWAHLAAEKALKSILVYLQVDFPKTHDLEHLLSLTPSDWEVHEIDVDLESLSDLSIDSRYPGDMPDLGREDARAAVQACKRLLDCVETELAARGVKL